MKNPLFFIIALVVGVSARLYQVTSVFRHGARYPLHDYYDANATRDLWGQLTAVGMRQHENLGKALRKDYIDKLKFLSQSFNDSELQIYTTNVNRTFQSALSQLYGLYPLGTGVKLPDVPESYRIPPYSKDKDAEQQVYVLPQGHQNIPVTINASALPLSCPRASAQMRKNENEKLETYRQMNLTYYPFMKKMATLFNFTTLNFSSTLNLYDTLLVDKYLGRPLPQNFSEDDYDNLRHLTYWYSYFTLSSNLSKAFNTPLLSRIIEDFDDRIQNIQAKTLKWTAMSAHDTNLFTLTGDLNISSADCIEELYRRGQTKALNCFPGPQFAASLIFQLHSDNSKDFYVKLRYNGEYVYLCEQKITTCSYEDWRTRVEQNILIKYAYEVCFGPGNANNNTGMPKGDLVQLI